MSINRIMDKEDGVHIHNGMSLSYEKNEIMPLAVIWVDPEMSILSGGRRKKTNII